jgi:inosose dehydratase
MRFHPHADYHVETQAQTERYLEDTDPRYVSLCLDTGHLAYRRADVPAIIRKYPERIGYVHIKQMDPAIAERAVAEDLPFGHAVAQGASVEPPAGEPDVPAVIEALSELLHHPSPDYQSAEHAELFVVVEQDMYPVDFDIPLPIATRTRQYLNSVGLQSR